MISATRVSSVLVARGPVALVTLVWLTTIMQQAQLIPVIPCSSAHARRGTRLQVSDEGDN